VPVEQKPRIVILGGVQPADPRDMRAWVRGEDPLLSQDPATFYYFRPREEILAEREAIDAVRIGEQTTARAAFTRQALAARGKAEPITTSNKKEDSNG
jgi:hypothetical protein